MRDNWECDACGGSGEVSDLRERFSNYVGAVLDMHRVYGPNSVRLCVSTGGGPCATLRRPTSNSSKVTTTVTVLSLLPLLHHYYCYHQYSAHMSACVRGAVV
jgi:hypothetical protein